MAKKKSVSDEYVQVMVETFASLNATGGAAGNIKQVATAHTPKDRTGMVIERIEYCLDPSSDNLNSIFDTAGDVLLYGCSFIATLPETHGFEPDDIGCIDWNCIERLDFGTAGNAYLYARVLSMRDFTNLRGGGLLVHPSNLYIWNGSPDTLGATVAMVARFWYHTIDLTDEQYRELWETRIFSNVI